jgi:hypothetical protein
MDTAVRELVRRRAERRCEYCRLPESAVPLIIFHIEHVIPRQHGGSDAPENRALACPWCNRAKGPNLSGIDADSQAIVPLFNPRTQSWHEHFSRHGATIVGISPTGRATVHVLGMNRPECLEMRTWLLREGIL